MIRILRIPVLALLALSAVFVPATFCEDGRSDETVLREIKEVLWPRAYAEQDVELLDSILADEFQMVDAEGNWSTKADELEWIANNKPSYDSFRFEIKRLEVFDNGAAIVAGTGHVAGTGEDGPFKMRYQSTNVLIKRDGRWKAVASHVSGITTLED